MGVVETFKKLGKDASYHYVDDSGKEWSLGLKYENQALELFDTHPELESELREVAKGFLWTLEYRRPKKN